MDQQAAIAPAAGGCLRGSRSGQEERGNRSEKVSGPHHVQKLGPLMNADKRGSKNKKSYQRSSAFISGLN
jgi:hypothetical protein